MPPVPHRHRIHPEAAAFLTAIIADLPGDDDNSRTADGGLGPVDGDQFNWPLATLTMPVFITVTEVEVERVTQLVTAERVVTTLPTPTFTLSPIALAVSQRSSTSTMSPTSVSPPTLSSNSFSSTPLSFSFSTTSSAPSFSTTSSLAPSSSASSSASSSTSSSSTPSFLTPSSTASSFSAPSSSTPSPSSTSSASQERFPPFPAAPSTPAPAQAEMKPLSPGVVVGIALSSILFALLLGICFIRQRSKFNRDKARTWVTPFVEAKPVPVMRQTIDRKQEKRMEFLSERWQRIRNSRNLSRGVSSGGPGNTSISGASRTPNARPKKGNHRNQSRAPITGEPREPLPPPPVYREPSMRRPAVDLLVSSAFPHGAVAKFNFEPTRPDELPVRAGDHLRVIALYEDGWAMCKGGAGQRGMVPTSCLRTNGGRRRQ